MLSNAYLLATFRFDTAENEPPKNLQNFAKLFANNFANSANPNIGRHHRALAPEQGGPGRPARRGPDHGAGGGAAPRVGAAAVAVRVPVAKG